MGKVDRRITMVTGLNVQPPYAEYLQVVNYGIGGHYEPHFDHATVSNKNFFTLDFPKHSRTKDIFKNTGKLKCFSMQKFTLCVMMQTHCG